MKRLISLSAASIIALAAAAAPALAQTGTLNGDAAGSAAGTVTTPVNPDIVVPDVSTTSSTNATGGLDAALAAINGSKDSANQLGAVTAVSTVNVVKIGELDASGSLKGAVDANKDNATGLQAAIKANAAVSAKLKEQNIDVSSVVGSKVEADGSITVFVQ